MGIVRGQEGYVGILIEPEVSWGTEPGTAPIRVPIISASDSTESSTTPPPSEIGTGVGGNPGSEPNTRTASGEFTTKLDYNADFFGVLMAMSMDGCETHTNANRNAWGADETGCRVHTFIPQSYLDSVGPPSLTITAVKSGDAVGYISETYTGAIITGWTIEQPDLETPRITWRWIATPGVEDAWSGSLPAVQSDRTPIGVNHGFTAQIEKQTATGLQALTVKSLSLEFNRNMSFAQGFLNKVGLGSSYELEKPGNEEPYDVTLNVEYPVEDTIDGSNEADAPYNYYLNGITGKQFRFGWTGTAYYAGTDYPTFTVSLPSVVWMDGECPIVDGILRARVVGRGQIDTTYQGTGQLEYPWTDGSSSDPKAAVVVSMGEDDTGRDATFNTYLTPLEGYRRVGPSMWDTVNSTLPSNFSYQVTVHFLDADTTESAPTQLAAPDQSLGIANNTDLRARFLVKAYGTVTTPRYQLYASRNEGAFAAVPTTEVTVNTGDSNVTDEEDTTQQLGKGGSFVSDNNGIDEGNGIAYEATGVSKGNLTDGQEIEVMYCININGSLIDRYRFLLYDVENTIFCRCWGKLPVVVITS